jgi:hypothetical protein
MEINYIKLGITIFLAFGLYKGIETYFTGQLINEATKNMEVSRKLQADAQLMQFKQVDKNRQKSLEIRDNYLNSLPSKPKSESKKLAAIRKTNTETCSYWTKKYKELKSDYSKNMKQSACNRARND